MCRLAKDWLGCTPSEARRRLDESDDEDFDLMIDFLNYDAVEHSWVQTSREHKRKFVDVVKHKRKIEREVADSEEEEEEDILWAAKVLSLRHGGDPKAPAYDEFEVFPERPDPTPQPPKDEEPKPALPTRFGR